MSNKIFFVNNAPHLLLEFSPNTNIFNFANIGILKIENSNFINGNNTFLPFNIDNNNLVKEKTNNSFIQNSIPVNKDSVNILNKISNEFSIRHFENLNPEVSFTNISSFSGVLGELNDLNLFYHTFKIYVLQGYNFDVGSIGFLTKVFYEDTNSGNISYVGSNSFLKTDNSLQYCTTPLRIDDRIFDRYLEIKVFSLNSLHQVAKIIDGSEIGLNQFSLPDINSYILKVSINPIISEGTDKKGLPIINIETPFNSDSNTYISIDLLNDNDRFNAVIRENKHGNYFEFFATYNNSFISDYIYSLGLSDVMVFHTLTIYEQSSTTNGYSEITTSSETFLQTNNWDIPYIFRPVIRNSNTVSFRIEYFMRIVKDSIFSENTSGHIIRRLILEVENAQRYGKNPQFVQIKTLESNKIINKVVSDTEHKQVPNDIIGLSRSNVPFNQLNVLKSDYIVPVDRYNICTSINVLNDLNELENTEQLEDTPIFKYGELVLELNKYSDYFLFFNLYQKQKNKLEEVITNNDENTKFEIIFEKTDGSNIIKQSIYPFSEKTIKKQDNSLYFRLLEDEVSQISNGSQFYIRKINYLNSDMYNNESNIGINFTGTLYFGTVSIK